MLKAHEQTRASDIRVELAYLGCDLDRPSAPAGPYARTADAIDAFRYRSRQPTSGTNPEIMPLLAELICIYSVGIVRGDGEGITPWPDMDIVE